MLVSCLMITQPGREQFATEATSAFARQSYGPRELAVLWHKDKSVPLGEMRNRSIARASGDLLATWDDDDVHGDDRLAVQIQCLVEEQADACFLSRITLECSCGYKTRSGRRSCWEQTMVVKRSVIGDLRYTSVERGSDSIFVRALIAKDLKLMGVDEPDLYIYRYHGGNIWGAKHFDGLFKQAGSDHRPSSCVQSRGAVAG